MVYMIGIYKNYRRPKHDIVTEEEKKKINNLMTKTKYKSEGMVLNKVHM